MVILGPLIVAVSEPCADFYLFIRVQFRKKTTCAPLLQEGHFSIVNTTNIPDFFFANDLDSMDYAVDGVPPDAQLLVLFYGTNNVGMKTPMPNATMWDIQTRSKKKSVTIK
jgi:hypothetical protein